MKDSFYVFLFEKSLGNIELTALLDCNKIEYNEKEKIVRKNSIAS